VTNKFRGKRKHGHIISLPFTFSSLSSIFSFVTLCLFPLNLPDFVPRFRYDFFPLFAKFSQCFASLPSPPPTFHSTYIFVSIYLLHYIFSIFFFPFSLQFFRLLHLFSLCNRELLKYFRFPPRALIPWNCKQHILGGEHKQLCFSKASLLKREVT